MSALFFLRLRWPAPALWFLKLYTSALSSWFPLISTLSIIVGLTTGSVFISSIGIYEDCIKSEQKIFSSSRTILRLPAVPNPRREQNISFATIPDTERKLLCDIWQPPLTVTPSGLALIYLHGSAWYLLDKDLDTRPFFSRLAAHGHVIVDVDYRLAPETDMIVVHSLCHVTLFS